MEIQAEGRGGGGVLRVVVLVIGVQRPHRSPGQGGGGVSLAARLASHSKLGSSPV